jgi:hypothetical protein
MTVVPGGQFLVSSRWGNGMAMAETSTSTGHASW